jgi:nucleoid-associated protein YgaU
MFVKLAVLVGLLTVAVALGARTSNGAGHGETYVVRAGDSLWRIAAVHYGGDVRAAVWRLQERNGMTGTLVRPGQRLVLP